MNEHSSISLQCLMGKCVTLTLEPGQTQLSTDDGWSLHIYNASVLSGGADEGALGDERIKLEMVEYSIDSAAVTMKFDGGKTLIVDLTDDGYSGPEAMQLNGPNGEIIIWS